MSKKIILTLLTSCLLPLSASAESSKTIQTTPEAIVCSNFIEAGKLEKAIKNYSIEDLMKLINKGKCWEVGSRKYITIDYDPNKFAQHVMLSKTSMGALLSIFIKK